MMRIETKRTVGLYLNCATRQLTAVDGHMVRIEYRAVPCLLVGND